MEPNTPKNLEELIPKVDIIPLLTIAVQFNVFEGKVGIVSFLRESTIPHITSMRIRPQPNNVFTTLRNSAHFIPVPSAFSLAGIFSLDGLIIDSHQNQISIGTDGLFAMVDEVINLQQLSESLDFFGKWKPARVQRAMDFYTARVAWFVEDNWFATIFSSGLSALVEGGLYGRWYKNWRFLKVRMESYAQFRAWKSESNKTIWQDQVLMAS